MKQSGEAILADPARANLSANSTPQVQQVSLQPVPQAVGGAPVFSDPLGLVANVRVAIQAVVGQVELTVAELFALKEGAALKLDTAANAPIDLYLDDKLVARGALVVIDDSFGIQLTDVLPMQAGVPGVTGTTVAASGGDDAGY